MIIWIASYPKSGNTWVRSILCGLIYTNNGIFDFSYLDKIPQYPSRRYFKDFSNNFKDINIIKKNWIITQDKINLDGNIKFLKTHNANCKIDDYQFTNNENTLAKIYIVRDPRNVITSISNHYSLNIKEAKNFILTNVALCSGNNNEDKENNIATVLGSWGDHYNSWTQNDKNLLIIRYEDLLDNPQLEIKRIINFISKYIKFEINNKKISNIIQSTSFENLKNLEKKGTFKESPFNIEKKKINFFHLGKANNWKKKLDNKIKIEIENKFFNELSKLKYLNK